MNDQDQGTVQENPQQRLATSVRSSIPLSLSKETARSVEQARTALVAGAEREVILPYAKMNRFLTCRALEKFVEPWAIAHVAPAMAGNIQAAAHLAHAVSNEKRGIVVVEFWKARAPAPAFRELLHEVWLHEHREVIYASRTRRTLRAMFNYARFDTSQLAQSVRVWRGTCALPFSKAVRGYSWTTDRDVACWFAMRFSDAYKNPLVLTAEIEREMIGAYSNERKEREVVLLTPPRNVVIDGDPNDWQERYDVVSSIREAEMKA
jgi:hypothetical protein